MKKHITDFSDEELIKEINCRKTQREKGTNELGLLKACMWKAKLHLLAVSNGGSATMLQHADFALVDARNRVRIKERELHDIKWG